MLQTKGENSSNAVQPIQGDKVVLDLAIVGLGSWGRGLVQSVQGKSNKARFVSAVVTDVSRSEDFAKANDIKLTTDYDSVLGDDAIKAVVSCGPAHLHAAHSLKALRAGKPVLAIKQMALTAADGRALGKAADETGQLLALGYDRCFYPNVQEMRRRLAGGAIGQVIHAEGNFCVDRYGPLHHDDWKADPANAPAGALADHMLYLVIETMGPIDEVHAKGFTGASNNRLNDVTAVLLQTTQGQSALLTAIGTTAVFHRFQIFGTKGWIAIAGAKDLVFQPTSGDREELTFSPVDAQRAEIEAFADAVAGIAPFPVPADQAVHSTAVIDAMHRSASEGKPITVAR